LKGLDVAAGEKIATRDAYGKTLLELGRDNPDIIVLDADLSKSTRTEYFAKEFPDRFFDFGVAEANMMGVAAGLATCGKIVFASSFCIFAAGRAWDQVRNTIAYSRVNVKIVGTHGGISVGADGASHQAIEDIALMRSIPGMAVIVPCDGPEARRAVIAAAEYDGPVYLRMGRAPVETVTDGAGFEIGKGLLLRDGCDVAIIACGGLVPEALAAHEELAKEGLRAAVIDMPSIKPVDEEIIVRYAGKTGAVVTAEEHVLQGGLGSAVCEVLGRECPVPVEMAGIDDRFGQSGKPEKLFEEYGLSCAHIVKKAKRAIGRKDKGGS